MLHTTGTVCDTYVHTCIHTCMHTYEHTNEHTHVYTHTRTYTHTEPYMLAQVNVSPSLSSSSPLDKRIKNTLMTDAFHLSGFTPYSPRHMEADIEKEKQDRLLGKSRPTGVYVCMYVCTYARIYVCVCMYVCMYVCVYVCMYVCQSHL